MKATLEFDLPEEAIEHEMYVHAPQMWSALHEIREWLRQKRKHGHDFNTPDAALDAMWDFFHEATEDFGDTL